MTEGPTSDAALREEREAVAAIALLAMYSDHVLASEEDERLRTHLRSFPLFDEIEERDLGALLQRLERESRERGGQSLLERSCGRLRAWIRPTAFLVACDIVASDGRLAEEESRFLAQLAKLLDLPETTARHILEVVEIRTRL